MKFLRTPPLPSTGTTPQEEGNLDVGHDLHWAPPGEGVWFGDAMPYQDVIPSLLVRGFRLVGENRPGDAMACMTASLARRQPSARRLAGQQHQAKPSTEYRGGASGAQGSVFPLPSIHSKAYPAGPLITSMPPHQLMPRGRFAEASGHTGYIGYGSSPD